MPRAVFRILPHAVTAVTLATLATGDVAFANQDLLALILDGAKVALLLAGASFALFFHSVAHRPTAGFLGLGLHTAALVGLVRVASTVGLFRVAIPSEVLGVASDAILVITLAGYLFANDDSQEPGRLQRGRAALLAAAALRLTIVITPIALPAISDPTQIAHAGLGGVLAALLVGWLLWGRFRYSPVRPAYSAALLLAAVSNLVAAVAPLPGGPAVWHAPGEMIGALLCLIMGMAVRVGELKWAGDRALAELGTISDQLTSANNSLADFAHTASHDLMEPLRKIRAFGELLETSGNLDDSQTDFLKRMTDSAERMQLLLVAMLNLSTSESADLRQADVPLAKVVDEVIGDLETSISQSGAAIEVGPLPLVWADEVQMRQLFQNLISNALKFHEATAVPQVYVGQKSNALGDVKIVVADNGIGFDPSYAERIFAPFERLHPRTVFDGTGIGLAICDTIVRRHGGSIQAESEPGHGATFTVTLPGGNGHV